MRGVSSSAVMRSRGRRSLVSIVFHQKNVAFKHDSLSIVINVEKVLIGGAYAWWKRCGKERQSEVYTNEVLCCPG